MREMKNSGIEWIGDIPTDWLIGRVKYVFYRKNEKAMQEDPVILSLARSGVRVRDMSNNDGQIAESYFNYNPVIPGDFLLNPMDLYSGANCNVSYVSGVISPAYINLRARGNNSARYYDYFFKNQYWAMAMFAHGKGVSFDNRWTISAETLLNYIIPIPSVIEQKKIADFLDEKCAEIDTVVERTKATIEEYKKLKQSVITQAVTKGIRHNRPMKDSDIEWLGNIPSEWSILKVKHLGWTQNGISKSGEHFGFGFPFISYSDVYKNFELPQNVNGLINSTPEEQENYSVEKGDIFFTRTSETIEEVGFSSVCKKTIPNAVFAGFLIRLRVTSPKIHIDYAEYYFRGEQIRRYLIKQMNLVTRASLGQDLLRAMSVTIPSIDEQKEIADYLDKKCSEIDELIAKKTSLLSELESYKKSLIYEYVTGKKEVL